MMKWCCVCCSEQPVQLHAVDGDGVAAVVSDGVAAVVGDGAAAAEGGGGDVAFVLKAAFKSDKVVNLYCSFTQITVF